MEISVIFGLIKRPVFIALFNGAVAERMKLCGPWYAGERIRLVSSGPATEYDIL